MANNYLKTKRNIPVELWEAWQKCYRKGEAKDIAKAANVSVPVIYAALNQGYVYKVETATAITKYFNERKQPEVLPLDEAGRKLVETVKEN